MWNELPTISWWPESWEVISPIRQETNNQNALAYNLLQSAEYNWVDTTNARRKYEEVRQEVIDSFLWDREITRVDLNIIKLELEDLKWLKKEDLENKDSSTINESPTNDNTQSIDWEQNYDLIIHKDAILKVFWETQNKTPEQILNWLSDKDIKNLFNIINNLGGICLQIEKPVHFATLVKYVTDKYVKNIENKLTENLNKIYWEKLWIKLRKEINEWAEKWDACTLTLREKILQFNKENNITNVTNEQIEQIVDWSLEVKKVNNDVDYLKLKQEMFNSWISKNQLNILEWIEDEQEIRTYLNEINASEFIDEYLSLKKERDWIIRAVENNEIIKSLSDDEIKELNERLLNWEDWHSVMKDIKEKYFENKTSKSIDNLTSSWKATQIIKNENWTYYFESNDWVQIYDLTEKELVNIWDNPDALSNLIDANKKLNKLWLGFVWENRAQFFKAMNIISWWAEINNLDSDSINSWELLNILNFVIKTLWWATTNDEDLASRQIKDIWKNWIDSNKRDNQWRTTLEKVFIDKKYIDYDSSISKIKLNNLINQDNWKNK